MVLWRRGVNVLSASSLMVTTDERIRLVNGFNLEISELEPQDAGNLLNNFHSSNLENNFPAFFFMRSGDYVCQINDKVNKDQVHTVEILGEFIKEMRRKKISKHLWTLKNIL